MGRCLSSLVKGMKDFIKEIEKELEIKSTKVIQNNQELYKLKHTVIAYQTIDDNGELFFETDFNKFPKSFNKQYVLDCIEADEKNLGIIKRINYQQLNDKIFTVADIETTGFSPEKGGRIIEIGAVKINSDGEVIDKFSKFINPGLKIPTKIVDITGITDDMVKDADYIGTVISDFWDFMRGTTVVFHNADFDWNRYLRLALSQIGLNLPDNYPCVDTLELDKELFPKEKKHTLDSMCERLGIKVENHHRAIHDAEMTAQAFIKLRNLLSDKWSGLRQTQWRTQEEKLEIKILSVKFWGKFKKDETMKVGRQYVTFICNGFRGEAFYDIIENAWYMKSCKKSFKAEKLEPKVLEYLDMSKEEFVKKR